MVHVDAFQQVLPLARTSTCHKRDLYDIFNNATLHERLFPTGVIVRDSQTFSVGETYTSNVTILLGDRLTSMYKTQSADADRIEAVSFGTGIESSVTRRMLRYAIDYYGQADADVIKCHVLKHLFDLARCLRQSATAEVVCCHVFILHHVTEVIGADVVQEFVWNALGFGPCRDDGFQQCLTESTQSAREFVAALGKL